MKILVTGAGGFLGYAVTKKLLTAGHQVVALNRSRYAKLEQPGIAIKLGDISHAPSVLKAAENCTAVIHTAAKAGVWGDPKAYYQTNVVGTENVLAACKTHGIRHLVHTSSPSVVHAGGDIEGRDESLPYPEHFNAPYPETKAKAEQSVLQANSAQLKTCALRPHIIWGPDDPHFLPRLVQRAQRRNAILLPAPEKLLDTVFVDNAADAHLLALQELTGTARCAGKTYFISNGEPKPNGEVVRHLLQAAGVEVTIKPVSPRLTKTLAALIEFLWRGFGIQREPPLTRFMAEQLSTAHWFDLGAAKRDFAYQPEINFATGLRLLKQSL